MKPKLDTRVFYNGKPIFLLNENLLTRQNCWKNLEAIKEAHELKLCIYALIIEESDTALLRSLVLDIEEIEFELQRLWKFREDYKFHRFWETPKCKCPKIDNEEAYPFGYYIRNLTCILHGSRG